MRFLTPLVSLIALGCSDGGLTKYNSAPEATILSPSDGDVVEAGTAQNLRGPVGDPNHALDELTVTWLIDGEVSCTDSAPNEFGDVVCEAVFAENGGEIQLEVKDPEGASAVDRITLTVEPPDDTEAPMAELTSPTADGVYYSDQSIAFQGSVSDAEDAAEDLQVRIETDALGDLGLDVTVTSEGVVEAFGTLEEGEHAADSPPAGSTSAPA